MGRKAVGRSGGGASPAAQAASGDSVRSLGERLAHPWSRSWQGDVGGSGAMGNEISDTARSMESEMVHASSMEDATPTPKALCSCVAVWLQLCIMISVVAIKATYMKLLNL